MIGRSPPGPFMWGSTTWRTNPAATAASKALPPRSSIAIPAAEASQWVDETMPKVPRSSGRVGSIQASIVAARIPGLDGVRALVALHRIPGLDGVRALVALHRIPGCRGPYGLPIAQLLLKLPAGALVALFALLAVPSA